MTGQLFAVVGPSGAGKDTLIEAARTARPDLLIVRRVITRPEAMGGEDFQGVTEAEFAKRKARGEFALDWRAHGLRYGLPALQLAERLAGRDVLFNGSRAALEAAAVIFPDLVVIRVTAQTGERIIVGDMHQLQLGSPELGGARLDPGFQMMTQLLQLQMGAHARQQFIPMIRLGEVVHPTRLGTLACLQFRRRH